MITKSTPEATPSGQLGSWLNRGPLVIYFASIVAIVALLVIQGAQIREALEADNARAVAEDDRAFCSLFDIGPGTTRYTECVTALSTIRSHHDQRKADFFF